MSGLFTVHDYTLEVQLDAMPRGWVCFAIGEGKPCIAPPPVADEIKSLASRLGSYREALIGIFNMSANAHLGNIEHEKALHHVWDAAANALSIKRDVEIGSRNSNGTD